MFLAQKILSPKYMGKVAEGNFTEEYYRDDSKHELLIIGNCEAYENISPMKLWEEYGLPAISGAMPISLSHNLIIF